MHVWGRLCNAQPAMIDPMYRGTCTQRQGDGNLVIYNAVTGAVGWNSGTPGSAGPPFKFILQPAGNAVCRPTSTLLPAPTSPTPGPCTLHPGCTLHPAPYTLRPVPCTLHPTTQVCGWALSIAVVMNQLSGTRRRGGPLVSSHWDRMAAPILMLISFVRRRSSCSYPHSHLSLTPRGPPSPPLFLQTLPSSPSFIKTGTLQ
jgi:hypothetical protein